MKLVDLMKWDMIVGIIENLDYAMTNRGMRIFACVLTLCSFVLISGCNATGSKTNALNTGSIGVSDSRAVIGTSDGDLTVVENLPPPQNLGDGSSRRISINDILEVDVFQVNDLDRTVSVEENGEISVPLIGSIKAAGLTLPELEKELERKYNKDFLQNAEISVFMKKSFGQRITLDGQFTKPGIYPASSQTTLLQAVAQAGGLTPLSDEKKIFVYRKYTTGKKVANFSIRDIRAGKKADPKLYGGDVIVAFTSKTKIAAQNLRQALGIATSATRVISPI